MMDVYELNDALAAVAEQAGITVESFPTRDAYDAFRDDLTWIVHEKFQAVLS